MPSCALWRSRSSGLSRSTLRSRLPHLGVEAVDEAPQEGLALVGELEAVRCDALCEDAERLAHRVGGLVAVPDLAGVELAALRSGAVEPGVLANRRGHGLMLLSVDGVDVEHDVCS